MTDDPKVTHFDDSVRAAGDPRGKQATWTLMPITNPNVCSQCGADHLPEEAHNQQSLHYQMAFKAEHGRWPSWADAIAHCSPEIRDAWRKLLEERGVDVDRIPQ